MRVVTVEVVRASVLDGLPHGFLGRRGGVSTGDVAGLNVGLGSSDDPAKIRENRRRAIAAVLAGADLATAYQVHSADVAVVTDTWTPDWRPTADALVTNQPGMLLGILTADCAPVLLADREAKVVGAAHAGWRGALAGVTDNVIEAMTWLGAERHRINAAVGPCIAARSYEVGETFRSDMIIQDSSSERFFMTGPNGSVHFDLSAYVVARLERVGIARVATLTLDTYADEDRFFSYRRSTHLGQPDYGRQISLIGIPTAGD